MEQFRRMLVSKLRVVFENASSELELWNKAASAQVDCAAARAPQGASSGAARRSRRCRPRPASSRRGSPRSKPRTSGCSSSSARIAELAEALREHAFAAPLATDAALVKLDLPLFEDAVPVEAMEQRQA